MKGLMILLFAALTLRAGVAAEEAYDLVVYGGTAGGVMTALAGAREGLRVALLEPRDHVGGMVTGGLSWSDIGREEIIGGLALEFGWRVGMAYYHMRRYMPRAPGLGLRTCGKIRRNTSSRRTFPRTMPKAGCWPWCSLAPAAHPDPQTRRCRPITFVSSSPATQATASPSRNLTTTTRGAMSWRRGGWPRWKSNWDAARS